MHYWRPRGGGGGGGGGAVGLWPGGEGWGVPSGKEGRGGALYHMGQFPRKLPHGYNVIKMHRV